MIWLLIAFALLWAAFSEGPREANMIAHGINLDHAELTNRRIWILGTFVVLTWGASHQQLADLLWYIIAAWGTFVPVHRFSLNRARGLHPFYVSASNAYDRAWLTFADGMIYRAGALAYLIETFALAIAIGVNF